MAVAAPALEVIMEVAAAAKPRITFHMARSALADPDAGANYAHSDRIAGNRKPPAQARITRTSLLRKRWSGEIFALYSH